MKSYLNKNIANTGIQVKRIRPKMCLGMVCIVIKNFLFAYFSANLWYPKWKNSQCLCIVMSRFHFHWICTKDFFFFDWDLILVGGGIFLKKHFGVLSVINIIYYAFIILALLITLFQLFQYKNRNRKKIFFFFLFINMLF